MRPWQKYSHKTKDDRGESGQTLIFVAILMTGLLAFLGLTLDYGQAAAKHRQTQNAADAAAQAAAYQIYAGQTETGATTSGDQVVGLHGYTGSDTTSTTIAYLDSTHTVTTDPTAVEYVDGTVTDTFPTFLLGMLGKKTVTVSAFAEVKVGAGNGNCAFCLLSSTQGLVTSGSSTIDVSGGNIWIDDANSGAITTSGNSTLTATETGVVAAGGSALVTSGSPTYNPFPTLGAAPVADPLAKVPAPSVTGPTYPTKVLSGNNNFTVDPGIYTGFIMSGSGTVTFNPGVYVFTQGITISGTWDFKNNTTGGDGSGGAMLYFTCSGYTSTNTQPCNGSAGAGLTWSGSTTYQITAPTSGPYKGLAIYYDRTNTQGITLSGSNTDSLTGTIYAKKAPGTWSGTFNANQLNSRVILDHLTTSGGSSIDLTFNKNQNYAVSSPPVFTQ